MKNVFSILVASLLMIACSTSEQSEGSNEDRFSKMNSVELKSFIDSAEAALQNTTNVETMLELASDKSNACIAYAERNKDQMVAAEMLFEGATAARTAKKYNMAINLYKDVIRDYPTFDKIPDAKFVIAFIYDEDLNNKDAAKKAYLDLIQSHPSHPFAKEAKFLIEQLYMTDAEIIEMLEKKNAEAAK